MIPEEPMGGCRRARGVTSERDGVRDRPTVVTIGEAEGGSACTQGRDVHWGRLLGNGLWGLIGPSEGVSAALCTAPSSLTANENLNFLTTRTRGTRTRVTTTATAIGT